MADIDEEGRSIESSQPEKKFFMATKKDITKLNLLGMNLVLFNSLALLLFYEVAFVYLVQSSDYFNVPTN